MNKLVSLLKASMSEGLTLFQYRGKTERSRRVMPLVLGALIWVLMFMSAGAMAAEFQQNGGNGAVLLSIYSLITSVIIVMEGIYKSGDLLFKSRDNDLLLSMPIPRRDIIITRMVKFYIFELLYCLIFLLPAVVAYAVTFEINAPVYWLVSITMVLLTPMIPIALSCVVGLISMAVASRFKYKNFFQIAFSFIFLILTSVFVLMVNTNSDFDSHAVAVIGDKVAGYYYPAATFAKLVSEFNIWQYLLFIVINLAVLTAAVVIVARFYTGVVTRLGTIRQNTASRSTDYKFVRRGQTAAIIRKEFNRYFNTPVLLMNTAIGLVLFLVAVGALCIKYDDFIGSLISSENFPLTAEQIRSFLPSVNVALVLFASLMTFITATMISLEGKAFNSLKTLPISGKKVIMSKVYAAMLLIMPVTLLGSIVMFCRFQFGILEMLLVLIAVVVAPLVTELIGILIDLKYARFNSESDAVVVKQSAGVMVATFLGLGMVLFSISLLFALVIVAGQTAGLLMIDAIFAIVAGFLYLAIATCGEEKYHKLSA